MPTLLGEGRPGGASIRSSGGIPVIEETFTFRVLADSAFQTRSDILGTSGLPIVNVTTSSGGLSVCRGLDAERSEDASLYWTVTAEFSSELEENNEQQGQGDPVTWVPIYETRKERLEEAFTKDLDDEYYQNSAGEPYDGVLTIPRSIPVWYFYQFENASVTDEQVIDRNETTNNATFKGRDIDTLLLTVESSKIGFYYGRKLRLTFYSLKYNKLNWKVKEIDQGWTYNDSGTIKPITVEDDDGNTVHVRRRLDGSGGVLAAAGTTVENEFRVFDQVDFSSFLRI